MGEQGSDRHAMEAVRELGRFVHRLDYPDLPVEVQARALLMLTDLVGVTVAGARTPEMEALVKAWAPPPGPVGILGAGRSTNPDAAAWLNGTAACSLELDEGNKHAQGHPAAHVAFAAMSFAGAADRVVSGSDLMTALVGGYEVAARFGRATRRRDDLHTHGHWGATGAGAAAGRLSGLPAEGIAAAIDAAAGLVYATPWSVVLAGSFVRNLWAAGANVSGLLGARLATAGLAQVDGTAGRTLGEVVGVLDASQLTTGLGERWNIVGGYFKRHSSCSYTHPAADAIITLRERHGFSADDVAHVRVDTHRLTMPLAGVANHTRLAAMFSLPYVVAVALRYGTVEPEMFTAESRRDPETLGLARRVQVHHDDSLDARLPAERANRVAVELDDGRVLTAEQPNPVGDADYLPFDAAQVHAKLARLLGAPTSERIEEVVAQLPSAPDARVLLGRLP